LVKNSVGTDDGLSRESYLKFDLGSVTGDIVTAKFHIYGAVQDGTADLKLYAVDNDVWTESGITWNNKPAKGGELSVLEMASTMEWQEIDITSYVQSQYEGDKKVSLTIARDVQQYRLSTYNSKENMANKPYLEIIYVK
jgi:hypothetical protein